MKKIPQRDDKKYEKKNKTKRKTKKKKKKKTGDGISKELFPE